MKKIRPSQFLLKVAKRDLKEAKKALKNENDDLAFENILSSINKAKSALIHMQDTLNHCSQLIENYENKRKK